MKKIEHLFVVDDDKIYQFIVKKEIELSQKVNKISFFTDGDKAFTALSEIVKNNNEIPDIILLDINMPVMDGWGFLDEFQKIRRTIAKPCYIYLVSSSVDERDMERSKQYADVVGYIVKPLKRDKLDTIFSKYSFEE